MADGELVENEITYMFLTALEHIKMTDPNGALSVNSKTSREIIEYAVEILGKGITHPAFFNDDVIVSALTKLGIERSDVIEYIHSNMCGNYSMRIFERSYNRGNNRSAETLG